MTNLMTLSILFGIFLLIALLWHQLAGICAEESMTASAITIMLLVFGCGFAGNTAYVYRISAVLAAAGLLLFLLNRGKGRTEAGFLSRVGTFISPSMVVIAVVFCYCVVFFRNALYTYPDEIYQWGSAVKYMTQTGQLPYGEGFTGDAVTFSICSMFQYFFAGLGKFTESNTFVGNFILTFVPVLLPCRNMGWKKWKNVFLYAAAVFLSFNLISYIKYYTILQDFVLPMWTGGVIAWLLWRREEKVNFPLLFACLTVIAAMKSLVGPLFACMILLTAFLTEYFRDCGDEIRDWKKLRCILQKKYLAFLPLCVTPVLINMIWSHTISVNVLSRGVGTADKSMETILYAMVDKSLATLESTTTSMPFFSYVIFFGIYFILIQFLNTVLKKQKNMSITILAVYVVGAVFYLGVMFYAYMTVFGAGDSETVAGLERYLAYYMLAGVCAALFPLFCMVKEMDKQGRVRMVAMVVAISCLYGTSGNFVQKATSIRRKDESAWKTRVAIRDQVEKFRKVAPGDGRIFVFGKLKTNTIKMLTYEFGSQYKWDHDSYTLDNREGDYDILIDAAKYPELLLETDYQYVWFRDPKEKNRQYDYLRHEFGFVSAKDGDIYEIVKTEDGYKFQYLGNVPSDE